MTDLSLTIAPKSDQLNADDLISGSRTITITKVSGTGNGDQPIAVNFEGDNGKPYKPCKSMRRVLVQVWGKDGNTYPGKSMTIYRDPKVVFGGIETGGIRISHMSDIAKDVTMALTATRANRKPFTVKPLKIDPPQQTKLSTEEWLARLQTRLDGCQELASVEEIAASKGVVGTLGKAPDEVKAKINAMLDSARGRFADVVSDDTFAEAAE
jgi:hypothetical protein